MVETPLLMWQSAAGEDITDGLTGRLAHLGAQENSYLKEN